MISFLLSYLFNYLVTALICFITTWIVMKILKYEYPSLVAFQVALAAPLGGIFYIMPNLGFILVTLIAMFIIKKNLNYEFKGMVAVMAIWIAIYIPLAWIIVWCASRLMIKLLFPPGTYENMQQYMREHRR